MEITVTTQDKIRQHGGMSFVNTTNRAAKVLRANKYVKRSFSHTQKLPSLKGDRIPWTREWTPTYQDSVIRVRTGTPKPRHRLPLKNDLNPFFFFTSTKTYTIGGIIILYCAIFLVYWVLAKFIARAACLKYYIPPPFPPAFPYVWPTILERRRPGVRAC